MGENDLGILLDDYVKALSPNNCQLYRISNYKHQGEGHNIFFAPWGMVVVGRGGERRENKIPYQINDVLHSLLHTLHPDLPALKLCYFLL